MVLGLRHHRHSLSRIWWGAGISGSLSQRLEKGTKAWKILKDLERSWKILKDLERSWKILKDLERIQRTHHAALLFCKFNGALATSDRNTDPWPATARATRTQNKTKFRALPLHFPCFARAHYMKNINAPEQQWTTRATKKAPCFFFSVSSWWNLTSWLAIEWNSTLSNWLTIASWSSPLTFVYICNILQLLKFLIYLQYPSICFNILQYVSIFNCDHWGSEIRIALGSRQVPRRQTTLSEPWSWRWRGPAMWSCLSYLGLRKKGKFGEKYCRKTI